MKLFKWFIIGIILFIPAFAYSAPSLSVRLKGRILLAVEDRGRTYYVAPDGYRYLITRTTAQKVFEKLAMGITNKNLEQIPLKELEVEPELQPQFSEPIIVQKYIYGSSQCNYASYNEQIMELNNKIKTLQANWDVKSGELGKAETINSLKKDYALKINELEKQVIDLQYKLDHSVELTKAANPGWNSLNFPSMLDNFQKPLLAKKIEFNREIARLQNELERKLLELE